MAFVAFAAPLEAFVLTVGAFLTPLSAFAVSFAPFVLTIVLFATTFAPFVATNAFVLSSALFTGATLVDVVAVNVSSTTTYASRLVQFVRRQRSFGITNGINAFNVLPNYGLEPGGGATDGGLFSKY